MAGWNQSGVQEGRSEAPVGVEAARERLRWHDLLTQTYRLYGQRFRVFFRMAFLPAFLAYLFSQADRVWIRPLLKPNLSRLTPEELSKYLHPHWYDYFLNTANAVRFVEGVFYWFVSGLLLAAVATHLLVDETEPRPLADAFTMARERAGSIFAVGLLAWTGYFVGRIVANFFVWRIVRLAHLRGIVADALFWLPIVLICGLLSRIGLAVPWLIDHPTDSLPSAITNSVRKTENWETFFMLFVIKSAIVGYALYWLADHGLDWLWNHGILSEALEPWISRLVYLSIAAALETPLFIALSILYREKTTAPAEPLPAPVG
jgi:hypothetical protein